MAKIINDCRNPRLHSCRAAFFELFGVYYRRFLRVLFLSWSQSSKLLSYEATQPTCKTWQVRLITNYILFNDMIIVIFNDDKKMWA